MTTTNGSGPPPPISEHMRRVRIAELSPSYADLPSAYVEARIALVWPYSSSTRQYAFLLSETDIRPLKAGRQLKVTLYNGVARTVQAAKVGIGDTVKLSLSGCQWSEAQDETATPGKRNHWDIFFRNTIALEVSHGDSAEAQVVQYDAPEEDAVNGQDITDGVATQVIEPLSEDRPVQLPAKSPATRTSSGPSTNLYRAVHDPFLDEIEQESGRSRKRTKFARSSGAWKLLDDEADIDLTTSSPTKGRVNGAIDGHGSGEEVERLITAQMSNAVADAEALQVDSSQPTLGSGENTEVTFAGHSPTRTIAHMTSQPVDDVMEQGLIPVAPDPVRQEVIDLSSPLDAPQKGLEADDDTHSTPIVLSASSSEDELDVQPLRTESLSSPIFDVQGSVMPMPPSLTSNELSRPINEVRSNQNALEQEAASQMQVATTDPTLAGTDHLHSIQAVDAVSPKSEALPKTNIIRQPTEDPTPPERMDTESLHSSPEDEVAELMPPPKTPRPKSQASRPQLDMSDAEDVRAVTPRLMPLASPGLPLVSPFIKQPGVETGYFPQMPDHPTALDATISDGANESDGDAMGALQRSIAAQSPEQSIRDTREEVVISSSPSVDIPSEQVSGFERDGDVFAATENTSEAVQPFMPDLDVTAAAVPAALEGQSVQEKSRDALAFLEEFLQMSPVFENNATQKLPGADENPDAYRSFTLDPRPGAARRAATKPMRETTGLDASSAELSPDGLQEQSESTETRATFDGAADRSEAERSNIAGINPPIRDQEADQQALSSAINTANAQDEVEQLPTPAATQQESADTAVIELLQHRKHDTIPQTPKQPQVSEATQPTATQRLDHPTKEPTSTPLDELRPPPSTIRRTSQRLVRKSDIAIKVDSPFFSSTTREFQTEVQAHGIAQEMAINQETIEHDSSRKEPGLRTHFGYYASLSTLTQYYGQKIDVIAIASQDSTKSMQAKSGPRDWNTTLKLTDQSSTAKEFSTTVQIFRPYKSALPRVSKGDVVILRCFKVQTVKHRCMMLSTDECAWAVFNTASDAKTSESVEMTGPHLEYGEDEIAYVKQLDQWWQSKHQKTVNDDNPVEDQQHPQKGHADPTHDPSENNAVIPSIEAAGASSPRRSRRLNTSGLSEESATSPTPDPTATTPKPPTRQQPSRRARTKTPVTTLLSPTQAAPTPLIDPSTASMAATSPLSSPTRTRRFTRSTLSPNPSIASNAVSFVSSTDAPIATSPTLLPQQAARKTKAKSKAQEPSTGHAANTNDQPGPSQSQSIRPRTRSTRHITSPPLVHELRDGMRYVDRRGSAEESVEEAKKRGVVVDASDAAGGGERRKGLRSHQDVHELRDGVRWVDQ